MYNRNTICPCSIKNNIDTNYRRVIILVRDIISKIMYTNSQIYPYIISVGKKNVHSRHAHSTRTSYACQSAGSGSSLSRTALLIAVVDLNGGQYKVVLVMSQFEATNSTNSSCFSPKTTTTNMLETNEN